MKVDLNKYSEFVQAVTSSESNNTAAMIARIEELEEYVGLNVALLMTSSTGLGSETGEFQEIVKKLIFQSKPFSEEVRHHMKRELGDVAWYWVNACRALNLDPNEVLLENIHKLESRYPGGKFDVFRSENRRPGDL